MAYLLSHSFLFLHTQHKELKNLVQGLKEEEKIHDIHKTNLELYIMSKNNLCQKLAVTCHLMGRVWQKHTKYVSIRRIYNNQRLYRLDTLVKKLVEL